MVLNSEGKQNTKSNSKYINKRMLAKTCTFTKTALYFGIYLFKALSILDINLDHFQSQKYTTSISAFLFLLASNGKQYISPELTKYFQCCLHYFTKLLSPNQLNA